MSGQAEGSKEETAYHEAGHAVIGCVRQRYPLSVSIVSDGKGAVGKTEFEQDAPPGGFRYFDDSDEKKRYMRTRVLIEVAGTIAHDIKYPGRAHDEGDANDDHWARQLVTEGVRVEDNREGYLAHAKQEAEALLRDNWYLVAKVAAALLRYQELSGAELLEVCELKPDLPSDARLQ
jgi:cell division protease FtsH